MQIIKMDNRAWKGIRLVTEPIKLYPEYDENKPIAEQQNIPLGTHLSHIYTIEFYVCANRFCLEREYEQTEMFVSSIKVGYAVYTKGSYAGIVGYSDKIAHLIKYIEQTEHVKIEVTDTNLAEQEQYDIEDNKRILAKYPSWKRQLKPEEIIS